MLEIIRIPYHPNTADLFERFRHLPHSVLLDSCQMGQFDILSADPESIINVSDEHSSIDPFAKITDAVNALKHNHHSHSHALPFTIGAIGYLSYDIGRKLETIPSIAKRDIQLPQAMIGIYHWSIVVDHHNKKTVFITCYKKDHIKRIKIEKLLDAKKESTQAYYVITHPFQSNMSKANYSNAFYQIKKHIYNGDCYQINLAQRFSAGFDGCAWSAYRVLRENHPAPFSAFMQISNGAILSLSPERFLKVKNKHVETKPIKGTLPRFKDPIKDKASANALQSSEKDRAENLMIVDLLRNDLSRACKAGSVCVPKLFALESFSNVHHLVSTITGELRQTNSAIDLLKQCFPGGSITGAPKIAAMKIIDTLEPHRRSIYCGSIFYYDIFGQMDSSITIRTLLLEQNKLHCYTGGGIVYDSDCEKEYLETLSKVGKLMNLITEYSHATTSCN